MQINFLASVQYDLNENYSLTGELAIPFLKREVNVDGLKRAYSFSVGFKISN